MNIQLNRTACVIGTMTAACVIPVFAQPDAGKSLAEKIVVVDISLAACSSRIVLDGFRFNQLQSKWREVLVAKGEMAQQQYKRLYDAEMIEVLRVMASDEKRACPYALARVKELMQDDAPVREREAVQ